MIICADLLTQIRKNSGILTKHLGILLVQNTKMNARTTEMKKQSSGDFLIGRYICRDVTLAS
jgi:hypothetical protein